MQTWKLRWDRPAQRAKLLLRRPSWRIYVLLVLGMLALSLVAEGLWGVVIGLVLLAWAAVAAARLDLPTGDTDGYPTHR